MATIRDPKLTGPDATAPAVEAPAPKPTKSARPSHYKVICISMYTRDLDELGKKVAELKRRGKTKMSKSELIRLALANLDIDKVAA